MNVYARYSARFSEEDGHPWVMAPELMGLPEFEALLQEALDRGSALSQGEIDSRLQTSVEWAEGVVD